MARMSLTMAMLFLCTRHSSCQDLFSSNLRGADTLSQGSNAEVLLEMPDELGDLDHPGPYEESQTALSRQHPWLPGRIGATTAISVSAVLTRLDIGVMIFHAFVVASWKMVGTRNAVQLPTQQPAVGKKRLRPIRRSLRTPLFRLH